MCILFGFVYSQMPFCFLASTMFKVMQVMVSCFGLLSLQKCDDPPNPFSLSLRYSVIATKSRVRLFVNFLTSELSSWVKIIWFSCSWFYLRCNSSVDKDYVSLLRVPNWNHLERWNLNKTTRTTKQPKWTKLHQICLWANADGALSWWMIDD